MFASIVALPFLIETQVLNNTRAQITKQRAIEIDQSKLPTYNRNDKPVFSIKI